VRDHFETFRARAAHLRDGDGLPRFVGLKRCPAASCPIGWCAGRRPSG